MNLDLKILKKLCVEHDECLEKLRVIDKAIYDKGAKLTPENHSWTHIQLSRSDLIIIGKSFDN